jgi:signal transduction histidine kinase
MDALRTAQQAPNLTEFVIEVDDTGLVVPKDKRKSVFEFYNQVEETSFGQEGSGLGLGIVQSLVSNTDKYAVDAMKDFAMFVFAFVFYLSF